MPRRLHILFTSTLGYPPERVGGAQISTFTLARMMQARGHRVEICFPQEFSVARTMRWFRRATGRDAWIRRHKGIRQAVFSPLDVSGFPAFVSSLRAHIARRKPDLIWVGEGRTIDLACGLADLPGLVVMFRDAELAYQTQHAASLKRLPEATYLANSQFIADRYRSLVSRPLRAFPPTMDWPQYQRTGGETAVSSAIPQEVLFVNPVQVKGLKLALQIADAMPEVRFCFLESWPLAGEEEARLMEALATRPHVRFERAMKDIREAFTQAGCLIVPSQWEEAWGRVITEAQTWGLPVIARNIGGIGEALGDAGLLMAADAEAREWVAAVESVLASSALHADLRNRGLQRVQALHSSADDLIDFLESLRTDKNASAS